MFFYLQQTLDPFSWSHDSRRHDARDASSHAQLSKAQLLVGVALLELLADAETHEAEGKDGGHADQRGAHT